MTQCQHRKQTGLNAVRPQGADNQSVLLLAVSLIAKPLSLDLSTACVLSEQRQWAVERSRRTPRRGVESDNATPYAGLEAPRRKSTRPTSVNLAREPTIRRRP